MSDDDQVYGFPKPSKKGKVKTSRINAVTDERAAQKALYNRFVRPAFLAGLARGQGREKAVCERCSKGKTWVNDKRVEPRLASEVHHIAGRDGWKLTDWTKLRGLCDACHDWVHANPEKAMAEGWLERRNGGSADKPLPRSG